MKKFFYILCTLLLASSISYAERADTEIAADNTLQTIAAEYSSGELSIDEWALRTIRAIKDPTSLPTGIYLNNNTELYGRGATMAIIEVLGLWDNLSDDSRGKIDALLARPGGDLTYRSPSGFFLLHYDTIGTHAVNMTDNDVSGIPDYVEKCALYCDTTLAKHIELGYLLPIPDNAGGDSTLDVYFENMAYYGYAVPEAPGPAPWNDYSCYLVLHNTFIGFSPNNDPEGNIAGAAKATCAHELQHCVQFAYDAGAMAWGMELDATWFEDIVFDAVDDNHNYLPTFFNSPDKSLMESSLHMYSSFIWETSLAERFDTSLMRSAWEGARYDNIYNAMADTLLANYGWTIDSAFAEFTVWNYITGSRNDGQHYDEASDYPLVAVDKQWISYPQVSKLSPVDPAGYGSCYIRFLPGGTTKNLKIDFSGESGTDWAAYIIKSVSNSEHYYEKIVLSQDDFEGSISVNDFDTYQTITLIGINISEYSNPASFTYSANLFGDNAISPTILTDSMIYSGKERIIEVELHNPAPIDDVFRLISTDPLGWITDTIEERYVRSDSSEIVAITILPTVGTPLGFGEPLYFRAESKTDPVVFVEFEGLAFTVLQRGDTDFNGDVDIGDLTQLIGYLFINGGEPRPVAESGDYNCDDIIDIGDLTKLIGYLFSSGATSPCNPF